jgi:O-antigen ligase
VRRPPLIVFAGATALLVPLLFSTVVAGPFWSPRYALLAVEAAVGLPVLVALLRSDSRPPAAAALAFAAWALLSFAFAPHRALAFWGSFLWGTGLLFVLALAGLWAVGVSAGAQGTRWVERGLLIGAGLNAGVALLQMLVDLSSYQLWTFDGRASGLWGNPVYLSGFLVGAVWLVACRFAARPVPWGGFAVLLAAALQVAGGRFGLGLLAFVVLGIWRAAGTRASVALAACLGAGLLIGVGIAQVHGGVSAASRASVATASGVRPRLESWWSARHAVARRPVLGHGPGRYRAATGRDRTFRLARTEGPDRLYADAHNLVVEYAVSTGVPGVALLGAWVVLAVRRAGWRAPLAGCALLVLAVHLVQPQNVGLTPLAFLALGAAAPLRAPPRPLLPATVRILAVAPAAALAGVLLLGAYHLEQARLDFTLDDARAARSLLPRWPEVRDQTARIHTFRGKTARDPAELARGRAWRRAAVRADPADPTWWNDLAESELGVGLTAPARRDFRQALLRNPWSVRAMNGLGHIELASGRPATAVRWFRRSLRVAPRQELEASVRELLARR